MRGSAVPPAEAAIQYGVFTAAQAQAAGYSSYRIRRLLRDRRWVVVIGSVYAEGSRPLVPVSLARAALLAAGTGSVISHVTAARMWELPVPLDPEVHVTVPLEVHLKIAGLRTHRVPLGDPDLDVQDGLLCTTLLRTVVDCLLWLPEEAGRALVIEAIRTRRLSWEDVRGALFRTGQRHGLARAWRVLADVSDGAHSEAEVRVHRVLRRAGVTGWKANVRVEDDAGLIGYADIRFDDVPLVIEIDGRAYHLADDRFQVDRARQNRLVLAGFTVLRFTWDDVVSRPQSVVEQVTTTRSVLRSRLQGSGRS